VNSADNGSVCSLIASHRNAPWAYFGEVEAESGLVPGSLAHRRQQALEPCLIRLEQSTGFCMVYKARIHQLSHLTEIAVVQLAFHAGNKAFDGAQICLASPSRCIAGRLQALENFPALTDGAAQHLEYGAGRVGEACLYVSTCPISPVGPLDFDEPCRLFG